MYKNISIWICLTAILGDTLSSPFYRRTSPSAGLPSGSHCVSSRSPPWPPAPSALGRWGPHWGTGVPRRSIDTRCGDLLRREHCSILFVRYGCRWGWEHYSWAMLDPCSTGAIRPKIRILMRAREASLCVVFWGGGNARFGNYQVYFLFVPALCLGGYFQRKYFATEIFAGDKIEITSFSSSSSPLWLFWTSFISSWSLVSIFASGQQLGLRQYYS